MPRLFFKSLILISSSSSLIYSSISYAAECKNTITISQVKTASDDNPHFRQDSKTGKILDTEDKQSTIEVKVGDCLKFINDDTIAHNVYTPTKDKNNKALFKIIIQKPGSIDITAPFEQEGIVEVKCAIHSNMKFKVNVTK